MTQPQGQDRPAPAIARRQPHPYRRRLPPPTDRRPRPTPWQGPKKSSWAKIPFLLPSPLPSDRARPQCGVSRRPGGWGKLCVTKQNGLPSWFLSKRSTSVYRNSKQFTGVGAARLWCGRSPGRASVGPQIWSGRAIQGPVQRRPDVGGLWGGRGAGTTAARLSAWPRTARRGAGRGRAR